MTRIFFIISMQFLCTFLVGQKSKLYVTTGINYATLTKENELFKDINPILSYHAGLTVSIPLSTHVSIFTMLQFSGKGAKIRGGNYTNPGQYHATTRPFYLELPINIVFNHSLKSTLRFFIGGGGYVALGMAGKNRVKGNDYGIGDYSLVTDIKYGKSYRSLSDLELYSGLANLHWFDYGLNGSTGLMYNKYLLSLNYSHGLKNINANGHNLADKNMHRVYNISIGYQLK